MVHIFAYIYFANIIESGGRTIATADNNKRQKRDEFVQTAKLMHAHIKSCNLIL